MTEELTEGVWNSYLDVEERGIGEIEESLEIFTLRVEDVEWSKSSTEEEITNLSVLDAKAMEFSVISPGKLTTWEEE